MTPETSGWSGDGYTATSSDRQFVKQIRSQLGEGNYKVTSPPDTKYNCFAWAAGDHERYWTPAPSPAGGSQGGYFWPDDAPPRVTVDVVKSIYEDMGYEECESLDFEPDVEKVALHEYEGECTHAARQDPDTGWWTSKLGDRHDISHARPELLDDPPYGPVSVVLARQARDRDADALILPSWVASVDDARDEGQPS